MSTAPVWKQVSRYVPLDVHRSNLVERLAVAFDAKLNVKFTPRRGGQGDPVLKNVS